MRLHLIHYRMSFFSILCISYFLIIVISTWSVFICLFYIMIKPKKKNSITVCIFFSFFFNRILLLLLCSLSECGFFFLFLLTIYDYFLFHQNLVFDKINEKKCGIYHLLPFFFVFVYYRSNLMMWQSITNEWPLNTERKFFFLIVYL